MGASLACLAARQHSKGDDYGSSIATLSPVPSLRRRSRSSAEHIAIGTLQAAAVNAVASGLVEGRVSTRELTVLPIDLLQLVIDRLVHQDALTLPLLQGMMTPWLHHLHLQGLAGVDDSWLPVVAGARQCSSLDLSGADVSDSGMSWLPWCWHLTQLRLQHCTHITDSGLGQVTGLTRLRLLDVEGCEALTPACLAHLAHLTALTALNLGQCHGLDGSRLAHIAGLSSLRRLSLGWCRSLGDVTTDPANSVTTLAALSHLTHLNLGGTHTCDMQLREVLRHMTALQELDVSRSCVTGCVLMGLTHLATSLRSLKLRGCLVSDAAAASGLGRLTALTALDLSCSNVSSNGLLALGGLVLLRVLLLDMCGVGDEACGVFRSLSRLEVLDLSDTAVGDGAAPALARCSSLTWLALCNTDCGDDTAARLAGLTRLVHLNLDCRGVSDACVSALLPHAPRLASLDLSSGRLTSRGAALLGGAFTELTALELCGGHITDRSCSHLARLPHLAQLNLAQNRSLSDVGLAALAGGLGQSLTSLNLSYTGVTDEGVGHLAGMKALLVVVLSCSCVSEAGVMRLKAAAPHLEVKACRTKSSSH